MEPEVTRFLKRIGWSLFVTFVWMMVNCTVGIMFGWGFPKAAPVLGNYLYWGFAFVSGLGLALYLLRLWKNKIDWKIPTPADYYETLQQP
ncbi:MAG: hypothetical protein ACK4HE_11335 [Chitinophagaceae bacterium]